MTEFEIKHGLSQDSPGPLGLEAPDDTPARTGNTARDQEMYAAGRAVGEENAKHNAAICGGWRPIESAPKDGTPVLLFARLVGVNIATNSPYAPTIHVGAYRTDLRIWTGSAYRNQLEIELEPTHWMPRPAFPDCAAPASPVSTVEQGNTAPQADVLEIARETGLRSFLHGVNAMEARTILQRFVDALPAPPAPAAGDALTDAARDVLAERRRQVSNEGWTPERDDQYTAGDMASAAACYATQGRYHYPEPGEPGPNWPWAAEWWKPSTYRRNLEKAGALILAEIERLDRAAIAAQRQGDA